MAYADPEQFERELPKVVEEIFPKCDCDPEVYTIKGFAIDTETLATEAIGVANGKLDRLLGVDYDNADLFSPIDDLKHGERAEVDNGSNGDRLW